jgi:hypothetical protein
VTILRLCSMSLIMISESSTESEQSFHPAKDSFV